MKANIVHLLCISASSQSEERRRQCVDCASQKEDVDSSLFLCLPQMYFRFELAIVAQDDIIVGP